MKRIARYTWGFLKEILNPVGFIKAFEHNPAEQKLSDDVRAFAKGFLEFIRNLAVVSAIKFFATRADSTALHIVAELGTLAVTISVATYVTRFTFTGWREIQNPKLRTLLTFIYTVLPGILIYSLLGQFVGYVVKEIVRSQLLH